MQLKAFPLLYIVIVCFCFLPTTLDHLYKQTARGISARSNPQFAVRLLEANNCCMKTIAAAAHFVYVVVVVVALVVVVIVVVALVVVVCSCCCLALALAMAFEKRLAFEFYRMCNC